MQPGYKQFCPVAMAAELLCTRWTMVLLRELVAGSTRFNDLRRGVPKMSPTLLSQRLRELEAAGIIERTGAQVGEGRLRIPDDRVRQGSPLGGRGDGLLGSEMDRGAAVSQESRSVAADVGHAAQSQSVAAPRSAHGDTVPVRGTSGIETLLVAGRRATRRSGSLLVRSGLRRRSLRLDRPPHDDGDLDGADDGREREGRRSS